MSAWMKITGTQVGKFILGLTGVTLKNNSGNLEVKNNADSAFADVSAANVKVNGTTYGVTVGASASQTGDWTLTLPVGSGSPGQVLSTDGNGVTTWVSAANTASNWTADSTSFAFGSNATTAAFTLPANAVVDSVSIIVDTAFDGTPTISVGVNGGSASKYAASGDSLLTVADRYDIPYQGTPNSSSEAIELAYSAGGSSVGAGRVIVTYAVPA